MRIALDATYSLGRNLSGVGVYSRQILRGLATAHQETDFRFCYRPHRFLPSFRESLPGNVRRRLLFGAPRADLFHALNQRVDVRARRTVATFHDLFVMTGDYSSPDFRARFTQQARQAAANSDAIIAVSRFTASQVQQFLDVDPARIHVVPHGVHSPSIATAVERENLVLCTGAVQRRKNIARLVKAFERMPAGWSLALAGAADGYGAAGELRAVDDSPRKSDIHVLGYVTAAELDQLYRRARIFAFPSLDEGFGMPVLEAMAHGIPVVTSNRSSLPEVAGDAALLVNPLSTEEIGSALLRLASDEQLRSRLERAGAARAAEFTWERAVQGTWDVYRKLLV